MGDADASSIRAVTWNIHGGVGTDGRRDFERIGGVVRAIAPDLAAFQEVDSRTGTGNRQDVYAYLRRLVGDHGHEAWSISSADGNYGQILASRLPLVDREVHDISVARREPRRVMEARIPLPGGPLRIIATHLGLRWGERRRQIAWLRDIIAADPSSPLLLLGDFNEWRRRRRRPGIPNDFLEASTSHASFPSRFPLLALDRIVCRPAELLTRSWVVKAARGASDHLPVVAELDVPGAG